MSKSPIIRKTDPILVTGGTGFLGTHVVDELSSQGFGNIRAVGQTHCELLNRKATHGLMIPSPPKCIIHLAGLIGGIGANRKYPADFIGLNLQMGLNVIQAAHANDVERIVMISSVCAYPKHCPVPFTEEHMWFGYPEETNAPYGIAKRALVETCIAYNKQYRMNNINLIPTNLYGPGDHTHPEHSHVIPALICKFYKAVMRGDDEVIIWGSGNPTREFLYVKDCANGIVQAMQYCQTDQPINLGSGREISINTLASTIAYLMNYTGTIVFDTTKPDGQPRRCVSTTKAKREFDWTSTTKLYSGLIETILWYEEQFSNGNISIDL
jgi:nucleoside-diphosphate-sugar epimerase